MSDKADLKQNLSDALSRAEQGLINTEALPEYKRNYLAYDPKGNFEGFMDRGSSHLRIKKDVYKHCSFRNANLIMDTVKEESSFDLIFCRNVLIYFDNPAKVKVIEKFYQALKPGGFFIVGFFDSVISLLDNKKFECFDLENRIFRKV